MRSGWRGLFLVAILASAQGANAAFITINAESYAVGTNVSVALPGATLSTFWGEAWSAPSSGEIFVAESFGRQVFASPQNSYFYGADPTFIEVAGNLGYLPREMHLLRIDFETPTNYVELWGTQRSDGTALFAYNSAGQLIETCSVHDRLSHSDVPIGRQGCWGYYGWSSFGDEISASVIRETADISYVLTGTYYLQTATSFTQVTYNRIEVPAPATLGIFTLGLLGVGFSQRRSDGKKRRRQS